MLFEDRRDAGRELARIIAALPNLTGSVVLGLPRGGVPVAYEVAHACKLPLDVIVVRKLGVPGQEELAMGAIASGGTVALNPEIVTELRISDETVRAAIEREQPEIERQDREYRDGTPPLDIDGRQVILVDDGLATGASMRAAARAVRPHAARVIIAVPVGAQETCEELSSEADQLICASTPRLFLAVGRFYSSFAPTSDEEVRELLRQARSEQGSARAA